MWVDPIILTSTFSTGIVHPSRKRERKECEIFLGLCGKVALNSGCKCLRKQWRILKLLANLRSNIAIEGKVSDPIPTQIRPRSFLWNVAL